jgi:hypothetical protein
VLLSGGYGAGKTLALGLKLLQLKSMNPDTPGLLVAPSWRQMWAVTHRRLVEFLRLSKIPLPKIVDRNVECYLDFGDGVPVFLRSATHPDSLEGIDAGWLLGDELRLWKRRAYEIAIGRVRIKCPLPQKAFASTPDFNWMAFEFNSGKPGRELITSPTIENIKNLNPDYIDNLRLSYSKRLQQAVLEGIFTVLEGAVYEDFDPSINSDWLVDYDASKFFERKTYLAIDPGFRKSACLWVQQAGKTEWVVIDQMMLDNTSAVAGVEQVNARGWPIDEIWCDPAADNTQELVALDTLKALRMIKTRNTKNPIRLIVNPWRSIAFGIDKVRTLLGGEDMPTRLWFAKSLYEQESNWQRGILKDLAAYRYPEMKDGHQIADVPLKDGMSDHSNDALRYLTVGLWLTTALRKLDPVLMSNKNPGYRVAA